MKKTKYKVKNRLFKNSKKTQKKRIQKYLKKQYYGGDNQYKIIGTGYKVKVLVKLGEPKFVYKVFEQSHDIELSRKQCSIQQKIQTFDETSMFFDVKIPKLYSCREDSLGETILKFQRIYNISDTDIDNPTQPINILLKNDDIDKYIDKKDKPLNYIKTIIGNDVYHRYVYDLGGLFAILNFMCQIKTDDVEIVFGKLKIDGPPRLFIMDFDQCNSYNLQNILDNFITNPKYRNMDFDILGRKHQMTLRELDTESRNFFNNGYSTYAKTTDAYRTTPIELEKLVNNILDNY